ncbi:MAG: DUF4157 domain-containing protein, partial [Verrucomicrobiota bacterium]
TSPVSVVVDRNTGDRYIFTADGQGRQFSEMIDSMGPRAFRRLIGGSAGNLKSFEYPHHGGRVGTGLDARGMLRMMWFVLEASGGRADIFTQTSESFSRKPSDSLSLLELAGVDARRIQGSSVGSGATEVDRLSGRAAETLTIDNNGIQRVREIAHNHSSELRQGFQRYSELNTLRSEFRSARRVMQQLEPAGTTRVADALQNSVRQLDQTRTQVRADLRSVFTALEAAAGSNNMRRTADLTQVRAAIQSMNRRVQGVDLRTQQQSLEATLANMNLHQRLMHNTLRMMEAGLTENFEALGRLHAQRLNLRQQARRVLGNQLVDAHLRSAWRAAYSAEAIRSSRVLRSVFARDSRTGRARLTAARLIAGESLSRQLSLHNLVEAASHGQLPRANPPPMRTRVGAGAMALIEVARLSAEMYAQYNEAQEARARQLERGQIEGLNSVIWWTRNGASPRLSLVKRGAWSGWKVVSRDFSQSQISAMILRDIRERSDSTDSADQDASNENVPDMPENSRVVIQRVGDDELVSMIMSLYSRLDTLADFERWNRGNPEGEVFKKFGDQWGVRFWAEENNGYQYFTQSAIQGPLRKLWAALEAGTEADLRERRQQAEEIHGIRDTGWRTNRNVYVYTRRGHLVQIDFGENDPQLVKVGTRNTRHGQMDVVRAVDMQTLRRLTGTYWMIPSKGQRWHFYTGSGRRATSYDTPWNPVYHNYSGMALVPSGNLTTTHRAPVQRHADAPAAAEPNKSLGPAYYGGAPIAIGPSVQRSEDADDAELQFTCTVCGAQQTVQLAGEDTQKPDCKKVKKVQKKCADCVAKEQAANQNGEAAKSPAAIQAAARRGLKGANEPLPHKEEIQDSFGRHDISNVKTRTGGDAAEAARKIGAAAFTWGGLIGFRNSPSLHLAAHEAAHVIQQRAGINLPDNIGRVGDRFERHADQVADAVVSNQSAEELLDEVAPSSAAAKSSSKPDSEHDEDGEPIQRLLTSSPDRLIEPPPGEAKLPEGLGKYPSISVPPAPESKPKKKKDKPKPKAKKKPAAWEPKPPGKAKPGCFDEEKKPKPKAKKAAKKKAAAKKQTAKPKGAHLKGKPQVGFKNLKEERDACQAKQKPAKKKDKKAAGPQLPGGRAKKTKIKTESVQKTVASSASQIGAPAIASAEVERSNAITNFILSRQELGAVPMRSTSLKRGFEFADGSLEAKSTAKSASEAFLGRLSGQINSAVDFGQNTVPFRLAVSAETIMANVRGAMESSKATISARALQSRKKALADAAGARAGIRAEYEASVKLVNKASADAIAALKKEQITQTTKVTNSETVGLAQINKKFSTGRTNHINLGNTYGDKAIARGQEYVDGYEKCKKDKNGKYRSSWSLEFRQALAQQNAACKTAQTAKQAMLLTAKQKAHQLSHIRKHFRCLLMIQAGNTTRAIDTINKKVIEGITHGQKRTLKQLEAALNQQLQATDEALHLELQSILNRERAQRQTVNDVGYLSQLTAQRMAHTSASGVNRAILTALNRLESAIDKLRARFAGETAPDLATLNHILAKAESGLASGMGSLLAEMESTAGQADETLHQLNERAVALVLGVAGKSNEEASAAESSFKTRMGSQKTTAKNAFKTIANQHINLAKNSATQGAASMAQTAKSIDTIIKLIGKQIDDALAKSLESLGKDLDKKLHELDTDIPIAAWNAADKEQPAWVKIVAIVLIILVVVLAAAVTMGALAVLGAGFFTILLISAVTGAVSGGLIQMLTNWYSGEKDITKGVGTAMVMGAVGGALGGGFGFAG